VQLSDGLFNLNGQITLISDLVFKGRGISATTMKLVASSSKVQSGIALEGTLRGDTVSNIVLSDFSMDGNRLKNMQPGAGTHVKHAFFCRSCTKVLVKSVSARSFTKNGYINLIQIHQRCSRAS
jgi:hypothetical protein